MHLNWLWLNLLNRAWWLTRQVLCVWVEEQQRATTRDKSALVAIARFSSSPGRYFACGSKSTRCCPDTKLGRSVRWYTALNPSPNLQALDDARAASAIGDFIPAHPGLPRPKPAPAQTRRGSGQRTCCVSNMCESFICFAGSRLHSRWYAALNPSPNLQRVRTAHVLRQRYV
jgi:hypothetical protein